MDVSNFTAEEIAAIERISKTGVLQAMDKVKIIGLTSETGRLLNGREGTIRAINGGESDGRSNPYVAQLPDGRYKVSVEFDETIGREDRPGNCSAVAMTKTFSLKRENLIMQGVGLGTIARDPEGKAILNRHGMDILTTEEREAKDPATAGWFPAILQGDDVRAREILEVIKSRGCPDPANKMIDATGDAGLLGGINYGHLNIVKLLLEYGANPNQVCNVPTIRGVNMTYFNMAMFSYDIVAEKKGQEVAEGIINTLLDGGADIHTMAIGRGTPLSAAVKIKSDHAARMRITRKLLEKGADPNQIIRNDSFPGTRNEGLILPNTCADVLGKYSETDRREIVQLLLDYGADPGKYTTIDCRGETCNTIHVVVSRKQNDILRMLLSCEKGRAAVNARRLQKVQYPEENNGNGETAITMCVACDDLERYKASRDMAVQLLRAGADIDIEDHIGLSASLWLLDRHPEKPHAKKKELHELVEKAKKYGPRFWDDSDEVKAFIEEGESEVVCCDNCGCWNNQEFADGRKLNKFQRCSRCKKVYYCSKACQKARWKVHKKSCIQCD